MQVQSKGKLITNTTSGFNAMRADTSTPSLTHNPAHIPDNDYVAIFNGG